jgi:hypothetical protein
VRKILESCPTCAGPLVITSVRCDRCGTEVRSQYEPCPFCRLTSEQLNFVLLFLQNRGNQTEMEKSLGVSYSTIRGKLDEILRLVAPAAAPVPESPAPGARAAVRDRRRDILGQVAAGKLDVAAGLAALRESAASSPATPASEPAAEQPDQEKIE